MKKRINSKCSAAAVGLLLAAVLAGCAVTKPVQTTVPETAPAESVSIREDLDIDLGQGLRILRMDRYAGLYMEDGSNDIVEDVMMLILENTGEADLQLARVDVTYEDRTCRFEVTNLPAGEKAVLLEQERQTFPAVAPLMIAARDVVFFTEAMALPTGLEIGGEQGLLRLTNTTDEALTVSAVFYKYHAKDLYYGGITFRVHVDGEVAAGQTVTVPAAHYSPQQSRVVDIRWGG